MTDFSPVTLSVVDNNGNVLLNQDVPFSVGLTARQVMEQAFLLLQTPQDPDPFAYAIQFYGYSEAAQYPGYMGYEVESLFGLATNAQFFWDLMVNGVASQSGADTTHPGPGANVTWQYTAVTAAAADRPRAKVLQGRRAVRHTATN